MGTNVTVLFHVPDSEGSVEESVEVTGAADHGFAVYAFAKDEQRPVGPSAGNVIVWQHGINDDSRYSHGTEEELARVLAAIDAAHAASSTG